MTQLNKNAKKDTIIINKAHPDWNTWRITKTPTTKEEWFDIRGDAGERVLFLDEIQFWNIV